MAIKQAKTLDAAKNLSCNFFVADDLRLEASGKVTAVGLYTDSIVLMHIDENEPPLVEGLSGVIEGICVLTSIRNLSGSCDAHFQLVDPMGEVIAQTEGRITVGKSGNLNLISRFRPLPVRKTGKFTFEARFGANVFKHLIEVIQVSQPPKPSAKFERKLEPLKVAKALPKARPKKLK